MNEPPTVDSLAVRESCDALRRSYDELPYGSSPSRFSNPDMLATVAHLYGVKPAPIDRCRVLELGCSCGGNIIPIAFELPESRCLGIDIAADQIAKAQMRVQRLGLTNIELRVGNIFDLDEHLGEFDYIICEGVFSWVPHAVQDQIFRICAASLSRNGVACISYNAYPGWHVRGIVRDLLQSHTRDFHKPSSKVAAARKLLEHIQQAADAEKSPLQLIASELRWLRDARDSYVFHEHLVEHNYPLYFGEFVGRAASHGLKLVSEVPPRDLERSRDQYIAVGGDPGDRVRFEQYVDFLENRQFHYTAICRASLEVQSRPEVGLVPSLLSASSYRIQAGEPDTSSPEPQDFISTDGSKMTTGHPFVKAALTCLSRRWPLAISFAELWEMVGTMLQSGTQPFPIEATDVDVLAQALLQCYLSHVVEFRTSNPPLAIDVLERPTASLIARLQAETEPKVTNMLHHQVELTPTEREVLQILDGGHDRQQICELVDALRKPTDHNAEPAMKPSDLNSSNSDTGHVTDRILTRFAVNALLVD